MELLTTRCFSGLPVDIYANDSDFWFLGGQIMQLLSYRNPEYTLKNIHERNYKYLQDLSLELEVNTRTGYRLARLYNFRGVLELCTFSHKSKANAVADFIWKLKNELETANTNAIQLFNYNDNQMRVLEKNNTLWFVAKDICDILELTNPSEALKSLYDSEKMTLSNTDGHSGQRGGAQFFNLINEPGLYKLIFKSRKPEAKKFQDWVFYEVLPEIRNTGNFNGRKRLSLPETKFYLAEDIAAELNIALSTLLGRASEKNLLIYGFTKDCDWYFTEEGRQKLLHETWL